ncbi:MAG TPA: ectoine/hydroxyectoine ABC transporter permease subunit EhuD [Pseudogracilibacillus sp.]|nr:ectoine/hydroxyectoine ABC transporter permease subunit EhuD [Pseudogracilibacillus sp.]
MKWDLFMEAFPVVMEGLKLTVILTIACYVFALLVGFIWVYLKRIPIKSLRWVITWIMEFIRSTPPLVQLFFLYYGLPVMPVIGVSLSAFTCAVLGLGLHFSTYIGEVYRSGIESVDEGQWEASTALNFSTKDKWFKIVLPQAIPPTIPMLGNYFIILFKEVPLASTIGVLEILAKANSFGSQHFRYIEALTIAALIFLVLSYPSSLFINYLERKMNRRFEKKAT